jgi:glycerate kinase
MARVLLAPDKFKGTLTAAQVAFHLAAGIRDARPDAEIVTVPVADGGDGLLEAFASAGYRPVPVVALDALGVARPVNYARSDDTAVIELAAVCGLASVGPVAPLTASTFGVGQVLADALAAGCSRLVLGIGGSASTDGGAGLLQALGARLLDAAGNPIGLGGAALADVAALDLGPLHPALGTAQIEVACDVDNPLTGRQGAAYVYGPQKGASPEQVEQLDRALGRFADLVAEATGRDHRDDPGAGAAGGASFGAVAVLGATLRPGVEMVLELMDFAAALVGADLVVTGEGSLDEQTLHGKAPAGVAAAARAAGVAVVGVAGRVELTGAQLAAAGFGRVLSLVAEATGAEDPLTDPAPLLRRIGAKLVS